MKLIFLSIVVFIYGYFCDICLAICEKITRKKLEKSKPLTGAGLIFISNFTHSSLLRWQNIEKKFIGLLVSKRSF